MRSTRIEQRTPSADGMRRCSPRYSGFLPSGETDLPARRRAASRNHAKVGTARSSDTLSKIL